MRHGSIPRALICYVSHIDVVDFSSEAIEEDKKLPQGDDPKLRWILGPIEAVTLFPPYDLITAGANLHWMDWSVVITKIRENLKPGRYLALIENTIQPVRCE